MMIKPEETRLIDQMLLQNGKAIFDETSERIIYLTKNYLVKMTTDKSGWDTLYQDPKDKRYWEKVYPQSEMHGGGSPSLINISEDDVKRKYSI
jgi:hypothetical protein